ncbi:MAG TPA: MaoC/PaaZ C-terminal domain-containing protein [Burkholderiales bacterium]|nr:MaoC/PaaZ C-terminal domain-containing protein [Burkholderiales bacterium]
MRLAAGIVGTAVGPLSHTIDARWLMAYAAALGETDARFFDTRRKLLAHPLFPVCYEWPAVVALREQSVAPDLYARVVHATHELVLHRAPRAGETLHSTARVVGVVQRAPGVFVLTRIETRDAQGMPVSVTGYGALYRGVALEGADPGLAPQLEEAPPPEVPLPAAGEIHVAANLAQVYTECARICNPIHTDLTAAQAAGLPGCVLHGTATLALSVSRALAACGADASRVRRVRCRFSGMVPMPSMLELRARREGSQLLFETACAGATVVRRGAIDLL